MINKRVKPVLISSSNKTDLLINTLNNKLLYDCLDIVKEHAKYYQLALISLDPNEKLDQGDLGYINIGGGTIGKISYDNKYNTWDLTTDDGIHYPFSTREYIKKVIATHDKISPKDIYRLVGEYNRGSMKEFDIEMSEYYYTVKYPSSGMVDEEALVSGKKPKLTDGYIIIVQNELSLDGFIRDKLSEIECMHDYSVGTDTVRCWLDEYNDLSENKLK